MSREIPVVPIELDKQRNIKLTGKAFIQIEDITGKNAFLGEIWDTMTTKDIITILWQGLLHEDPELTMDDVAEMYHPGIMADVMQAIQSAWIDAVDIEKIEGQEQKKDPLGKRPRPGK